MSMSSTGKGDYAKVESRLGSDHDTTKSTSRRHKFNTKSWTAPATMLSTFALGLAVAFGQHVNYAYLDGKPVADASVSQAWISWISTGLAFLAKLALTICVGTAYVQHQWMQFQKKTYRVVEVDTLTNALGNFLCFAQDMVLYRLPMLAFMALASWTLPLSAIVTPGALSVEPVRVSITIPIQVPQPEYANFTKHGTMPGGGGVYNIYASGRPLKLITNTGSSSSPVRVQADYQNQSYGLPFDGPAVKCRSAEPDLIHNVTLVYQSRVGFEDTDFAARVPQSKVNYSDQPDSLTTPLDLLSPDVARIFIMTSTGNASQFIEVSSGPRIGVVNVTECHLYNATYSVDFTFRYPDQTVTSTIQSWLNPVPAIVEEFDDDGDRAVGAHMTRLSDGQCYLAMMAAFGRLLNGNSTTSHYGTIIYTGTSWEIVNIDWSRAEAVQAGLEQLFQNFKLSLLREEIYIKNSSTAEWINTEVETWPITYIYSPQDLVVAYGLSLGVALICTLVGMRAFLENNASYQNIFSTYLRATNNAWLSRYIEDTDAGEDPVPKAFGEVRFRMSERKLEKDDPESASMHKDQVER